MIKFALTLCFTKGGLSIASFVSLDNIVVNKFLDLDKWQITLHWAMKAVLRAMSTPDQSFSILLVANAQYSVRKSVSLLPGTVEKLK